MSPVTAWGTPNFRRLWAASAVSTFGSEVAELALPLLALLTLAATPGEVGALRVAQFLPFLLATLPLGLLVDRRHHQRLSLMIGADLGRFVAVALIPAAVWLGMASMELLYAVVLLVGLLTVLYQLADFAFLPSVVPPGQLVDANGKVAAATSANEIGGRGLGGLLVQVMSAPFAVALNAVAFLVSGLTLRRIQRTELRPPELRSTEQGDLRSNLVAGLRHAVGNRYVRPLLGEATTYNVFNEMLVLGLLLYLVRERDVGAATVGLLFTAGGVGSFVGAWFGARLTGRYGYGRVLLATMVLGNSAPLAVVLVERVGDAVLVLLCGVFLVMGAGIGIANVHGVTLRQTVVAEHLHGRVNAGYRLVSWGAIPVGAAAGGLLAAHAGAQTTMVVGAVGVAAASLWVVFSAIPRLSSIATAAHDRGGQMP